MARPLLLFVVLLAGELIASTPVCAQQPTVETRAATPADVARDVRLQQHAVEQARRGDWVGSMRTLARVADGRVLAQSLQQVTHALPDASGSVSPGTDASSGAAGEPRGGRGGASFADFTPLMELIQASIAPDTWEPAGGTGTVRPFPGGILVDPSGLVTELAEQPVDDNLIDHIAVSLADESPDESARQASAVADWRLPTRHRCVSLRGVAQQVLRTRVSGQAIDDELRHLAGLSRIEFLVLVPQRRDVVLIGPVSGIESHQGWLRDRRTGLPAMRLDFFAACVAAVVAGEPFGCSIDPAPESLATASRVSDAIRRGEIPLGRSAESLQQALGEQAIRVFGTAGDTPLAHLMVEADRHMKQLALGLQPMPPGSHNYLDIVKQHIELGPPDGQLLRLWFTGAPQAVRVSSSRKVYQLGGRPMKLASETQLAGANGERLDTHDDIRLRAFVDAFNDDLSEIIRKYPAYGGLQSVYQAAAVAELVRRSEAQTWIAELLAPLLIDDPSGGVLFVPRRVESIAVGHRIEHRRQRHFVLLASGGVRVEPAAALAAQFEPYPAIAAVAGFAEASTAARSRWWWNAEER
jgi:hypothetical protein